MRANESLLERIHAERHVGLVRAAIVGLNTLAYLTILDTPGSIPALAYAIIAVAVLYSLFVVAFEPYRRFPVLLSAWTTTVTDGALITLWLVATGGFDSPFFPLWYASLAAVSYRFDDRATLVSAAAYSLLYVGLTAMLGQLAGNEATLLVRVAYIGFVGALGALMAREAHSHIHARLEMREEMREARTAEAKFRGLLEAAPDPIVIVDRAGHIVLANSQAERAFGYAKGEMLGARVEMLLPDDVRAVHSGHRDQYFEEPQARPMGIGLDLQARRKDGSRFPVEISLSPMETEEGLLVTSIIHDVTERKKAEEERLTSLERLKELERLRELDKFKTAFINTAAHELGTPLTPIKLQLHILRSGDGAQLSDRQRKALEILDRNVERLNALVQEVLKVARLQAGRLGITKERVDLNRVVFEAVESFQEPARESGIELEMRTTPGLQVDADPKRVTQVLFNLLNNAWKFTPDGGRITIETARVNELAVVRIRDTGQGMRPEDLQKLFQPFSQVHDTMQKTQAGTGLGLYICKGIVELHGGRIWAESPGPGLGSTFSFAIPLEAKPEVSVRPPIKAPEPAPQPRKAADTIAKRARELI
jgi:PAS domain S-box-containing protein